MYTAKVEDGKIRLYDPMGSIHSEIGMLIDKKTYKDIVTCAKEIGWEHDYEMQVTD